MKEKSRFIGVGIAIYIALSGIDRFVYPIPNVIYIPVAILGIALIFIGFFFINHKVIFDYLFKSSYMPV